MSVTDLDAAQIVDLIKRSDRGDAIELLKSALAVAHGAGARQGTVESYQRTDEVLASFMPMQIKRDAP